MYNSIVVAILVSIWDSIRKGYEYSILKKIVDGIVKGLKYIGNGSNFIRLFTSDRKLFEESFFYTVYSNFIDLIYKFSKNLRVKIKKYGKESRICSLVNNLFKDEVDFQETLYIFFITFGIGIVLVNLIRGKLSGKSYIVSLALILFSIIGLNIKENYKKIVNSSVTFRLAKSIFSIDEGGEQWW